MLSIVVVFVMAKLAMYACMSFGMEVTAAAPGAALPPGRALGLITITAWIAPAQLVATLTGGALVAWVAGDEWRRCCVWAGGVLAALDLLNALSSLGTPGMLLLGVTTAALSVPACMAGGWLVERMRAT